MFSASGANLEHQAFVLMAELEQLLTQLGNPTQPPSRTQALGFLTDIANYIIVFAEQLPIDHHHLSLEALVEIAPSNYSQLHIAHISNGRLTTSALPELSADPRTFRGLSNDLLRVINIYLNIFAIVFEPTESKVQWLTLFKGFTIDLAITVHNMQPDKLV
ncbi:MAG: hypothetical protein O7G88_00245 [bacterium]|nr:hypothetical protein [bacterium]